MAEQVVVALDKKSEWYQRLLADCRKLITKEAWSVIKLRHELGLRILRDKASIPYGRVLDFVKELASDLGMSWQNLYHCTKFADRFPDLDKAMEQFREKFGEDVTWKGIVQEWLYEKQEKEKTEQFACDGIRAAEELLKAVETQYNFEGDCSKCEIAEKCKVVRKFVGEILNG